MDILSTILTVFSNAFITLYFYLLNYSIYICIGVMFLICGVLEFHEKEFLFVDDERKVV